MKTNKGLICLIAALIAIQVLSLFAELSALDTVIKDMKTEIATTTLATDINVVSKNSETIMPVIPKILLDISWCESRNDQQKKGYNYSYKIITLSDGSTTTKKYIWSTDIGRWQINDYYHLEKSKALGLDIYTEVDNAKYALLLYTENGTSDWLASKSCWVDIEAWKKRNLAYYKK